MRALKISKIIMTALKVRLIIMRALVTLLRPTLTREDQQQGGVGGKLPFAPNPSILLLSNYLHYISENFQNGHSNHVFFILATELYKPVLGYLWKS